MRMQFITILIMCILAGAEVDLFIPSFPELQRVFGLSPFLVEFTLGANFCAYCVGALLAGALGDHFGRRRVILGGCLIFILGSILCVWAPHFSILIAGRILQGLGIAGPAVLAYVVIADTHSAQEQPRILGLLNGITTLSMAFAPIIGSYVNLFFNWQGNFVVLLGLGLASLAMGWKWIPASSTHLVQRMADGFSQNTPLRFSLKPYLSLFKSKAALAYLIAICFFCTPYWVFIGMAPVLYMEDLGVPLQHFGYYQGVLAGVFSILSLSSGRLLKRYGQHRCIHVGLGFCWLSIVLMMILAIRGIQNPLLVTGSLLFLCAGIVFPIHILYPYALEVIAGAKARLAAMILSSRLLLTAFSLALVSYYYVGTFERLAYGMCLFLAIGFIATYWILHRLLRDLA